MAETAKRASTDTVENGPFEMASLKKTKAPAGTEGGNWYKYVINQGANRIVGYRQGSLAAVTEAVEEAETVVEEAVESPIGNGVVADVQVVCGR